MPTFVPVDHDPFSGPPDQPYTVPVDHDPFVDKLLQTWPARLARTLINAAELPGDVYSGRVPVTGLDGYTNQEVINRAADLAGMVTLGAGAVPAEANALRSGFGRSEYLGGAMADDANKIRNEVSNVIANGEHEYYGLRVTQDPIDPNNIQPSRVWINGKPTQEFLSGPSAIGIRSEQDIERALKNAGYGNEPGPFYHGEHVALIGGNRIEHGEDYGEYIFHDPTVIGQWRKPFGSGAEWLPRRQD
ncbi:MAG TPA: hypothetical protein VFX37_10560 [Pseudolabrys sp.]|nr:hypothetical protein [Pseudolabrys sp.]